MRTHFRIFILAATLSIPVLTAISFMYYWLKPLNMLEQNIATVASNSYQLLPPPANSRISLPVLDAQYQLRSLH